MVNNILADFIVENELEGKYFSLGEKRNSRKKLLRTNVIFHREVAELCGMSYSELMKSKKR